jgi:hypothetical protein
MGTLKLHVTATCAKWFCNGCLLVQWDLYGLLHKGQLLLVEILEVLNALLCCPKAGALCAAWFIKLSWAALTGLMFRSPILDFASLFCSS